MKTMITVSLLALTFQAHAKDLNHPCKKAVERQVKELLASEVFVTSAKSVSVENDGDIATYTVEVASSTKGGGSKVTELYTLNVDAACRALNHPTAVPDSQKTE